MSTSASYVGDGTTRAYNITFPFTDPSTIYVSVDGANAAFTWTGATQITIGYAPASGADVRIYRKTPVDNPAVVFTDTQVLTADDMNDAIGQVLHGIQEVITSDGEQNEDLDDLRTDLSRNLRLPAGEAADVLPSAGVRALTLLGFDDIGRHELVARADIAAGPAGPTGPSGAPGVSPTDAPYSAVGDGVADDGPAIAAAINSGNRITLGRAPVAYRVGSIQTFTLTSDIEIDCAGQKINFDGGALVFLAPTIATGRLLAANALRYATALTLDSAADIQAGDLLAVDTTVIAETGWSYKKKDVVKVRSVVGNIVELEDAINFAYATSDTGLSITVYRPRRVRLINPNVSLVTAVANLAPFDFQYVQVEIVSPRGEGLPGLDRINDTSRYAYRFYGTYGSVVRDADVRNLSYPILISAGARDTLVDGIRGAYCRHLVVPTDWASGITVLNLRGTDNWQSLDSHPAFDVVYDGVKIDRDTGLSNIRSVRGALRNCRMHTLAEDGADGPYYHSLTLAADASYLYDDADFHLENVEILSPNRSTPTINVMRGRTVFVDGLVGPERAFACSTTTANAVGLLVWGPRNRIGGRPSPTRSINDVRCPVRIMQPPRLDAYVDAGVYHVDPRKQMVDQNTNRLQCYGNVARMLAGSPQTLPVRIHTNAFGGIDTVAWVHGILRVTALIRHSSVGGWAQITKEWRFQHKAVATSSVDFPLDGLSPVAILGAGTTAAAPLLTVANPAQQGSTELGASADFVVSFDLAAEMAGVTSPIIDLDYELELIAQQ